MTMFRRIALVLALALPSFSAAAATMTDASDDWFWSFLTAPVDTNRGLGGALICALIVVLAGQLRTGKDTPLKR